MCALPISETKAKQWNFCSQWSEPKIETLALFVPGLFGYKMDTPYNMEFFGDNYRGPCILFYSDINRASIFFRLDACFFALSSKLSATVNSCKTFSTSLPASIAGSSL